MFSLLGIPSIVSAALNFLSPVLSAVLKFLAWYLSEFWDGLKTIFSNLSTLVVIGTICFVTLIYGTQIAECNPVFPDLPSVTDPSTPWRHNFGIR